MNGAFGVCGAIQRWMACVLIGMVVSVDADDKPSSRPKLAPIRVSVRLPHDAVLEVMGKKADGDGESREQTIEPLKEAETLITFKATWTECDTLRTVKRSLRLNPGAEAELDLNLPMTADEKMVLTLVNKEREKMGLRPLIGESKLNRAARSHSLNMAKNRVLTHTLDGKGPADRLKDVSYPFLSYGENCGVGARTPAAAVQMWMNSPPHKENMLNGDFTETGIGIAPGHGGKFYTQVFAIPPRR